MIVGGIVVIAGNLTFNEYLRQLVILAAAFGLLGIGRGIKAYNGEEERPVNVDLGMVTFLLIVGIFVMVLLDILGAI